MQRHIYLLPLLLIMAFGFWSDALANEASEETVAAPELIITIDPIEALRSGGYLYGQIVFKVRLLSEFPYQALTVNIPDVVGADKVELMRPRNRQAETFAGTRFVYETAFALFPTHRGNLWLSPITAEGVVSSAGKDAAFSITGPAYEITIAGADARFNDPWWLVAETIEMTETWSKPLEDMRAGDTVRRNVKVVARGTTAAHLPVIEHGRTVGVTATQIERIEKDQTTIDGVVATLNQSWLLKFEPQTVTFIPPLGITYWAQNQGQRKKASVPGRRLELLPADSAAMARKLIADAQADSHRFRMMAMLLLVIALLPVLGLAIAGTRAILPTMADLRLGRLLKRHEAGPVPPERLYRALLDWADASGFKLEEDAEHGAFSGSLAHCLRDVFGAQPFQRINEANYGCLMGYARRQRVSKLQSRLSSIADWWHSL